MSENPPLDSVVPLSKAAKTSGFDPLRFVTLSLQDKAPPFFLMDGDLFVLQADMAFWRSRLRMEALGLKAKVLRAKQSA